MRLKYSVALWRSPGLDGYVFGVPVGGPLEHLHRAVPLIGPSWRPLGVRSKGNVVARVERVDAHRVRFVIGSHLVTTTAWALAGLTE